MKITRTLLACCLLLGSLASHAGGIDFLHNKTWTEILAQAKKENKLIFLDAYASWCGPCKYMQSDVFTDVAVAYYYNKNFINVKMDMEQGEGPQLATQLGLRSYPTLFFIDSDGNVVHKRIGVAEPADFLQLGEDARNPAKQFYTAKEKALQGTLDPADFHQWIHEAGELDEDPDSVIVAYLAITSSPRMEKAMLSIMLDHAPLNKEQIDFLLKNREACIKIVNRTEDEFNAAMEARVTVYATNESLRGDGFDFAKMQKIVQAYFPAKAALITRKVKIRYYNYKDEYKKSLDELSQCITSPDLKLRADELADLITQNIKTITSENRIDEFIQKVSRYTLLPADGTKAYQRNLSLLVLYYCKDDRTHMKIYSQKIAKDPHAPEDIKSKVNDMMDEVKEK